MAGLMPVSRFVIGAAVLSLAACGPSGPDAESPAPVTERPASQESAVQVTPRPEAVSTPIVEEVQTLNMPDDILGVALPVLMSGTEPFWSGSFEGGWITFDRPGLPLIEVPIPALPAPVGNMISFDAEGLSITLTSGGCEASSGALGVSILFEESEYLGCAGAVEPDLRTDIVVPDWYQLIEPALSAVDACLEEADGPRFVRALYPREEGTVGMILVDSVGRYEECGAEIETGTLGFFDPVSADQAEVWFDGEVMFARAGHGPSCNILLSAPIDGGLGSFHPAECL